MTDDSGYHKYSVAYADNTTTGCTVVWSENTDYHTYTPSPKHKGIAGIDPGFAPLPKVKNKLEGAEWMVLYDVYMVYAADRKNPVVVTKRGVIARDEESAKVKSGLMKEVNEEWDSDYLNFICVELGDIKAKERPKEVRNI